MQEEKQFVVVQGGKRLTGNLTEDAAKTKAAELTKVTESASAGAKSAAPVEIKQVLNG